MDNLELHDIIQLFQGVLVRYKDSVVKVEDVLGDKRLLVFDLATQRRKHINFNLEELSAPIGRIGFVNHGNWAFYVTRRPLRRYNAGLIKNNIKIDAVDYPNPARLQLRVAGEEVSNLKLRTVLNSINGEYPSLEEALQKAKDSNGVYAFDRQFAITYDRNILFRTQFVGILPPRTTKKERIVFKQEFEHLDLLLNQDYEKTARTFAG